MCNFSLCTLGFPILLKDDEARVVLFLFFLSFPLVKSGHVKTQTLYDDLQVVLPWHYI